MDLKGSKTEQNLYKAFAGESRARVKYNLYAERAKKDGYQWIAEIFNENSKNELAHAREVLEKYLKLIGCTKDNLLESVIGEGSEADNVYIKFEEDARNEGFNEIADFFKELSEVEEAHSKEFKELYDKLEDGTIFKGPDDSSWTCMNCGYIYNGAEAPLICPLCKYPRAYFKPYYNVKNE